MKFFIRLILVSLSLLVLVGCQTSKLTEKETIIQITTQTGGIKHSGTDATVGVIINNNVNTYKVLDIPDFNDFKRGAKNSYTLISDLDIDEIKTITITIAGNDAWLLKDLTVRLFSYNKQTQAEYKFEVNRWFSSEKKDSDEVAAVKNMVFDIK